MHVASPFLLGRQALSVSRQLGIPSVAVYQTDIANYTSRYGMGLFGALVHQFVRNIHRLADETLQRMGDVDILVNNAGAAWGAPAEDHPVDAWDKVMNLNIRGYFLLSQAVAKRSSPRGLKGCMAGNRKAVPCWCASHNT